MVRNYRRKTKDPDYTLDILKQAVEEVKNGVLNSYQAAKKYNIPRTTIVDRIKLRRGAIKEKRGRPTTIDRESEKRLTCGLHTMEKYGFGLSSKETTILVTNFIQRNKIKTSFRNDTPGYDRFAGFLKRNKLSLKKPQAVEMSRKAACDPFIVEEYFDTLETCINDMDLTFCPEKIWNLDESSFSKDPEKTKVVGARGYASTRTIASAGKDNVTVLFTANALGEKLPPLIIYRGKNIWDQWMSAHAFENTTYAATQNGWIESKVFERYMLKIVLPHISKDAPCLLIYDGHSTHIQLHLLEKAKEMGVTILKLPSHASHLLQPLDLAVFKSMKDKWDAKLLAWQRLNVGAKLQKHQFSEILGEVWRELDPKIIRNGFKKGGVYPLNKSAIPQDKFDPASLKRFNTEKSKRFTKKNIPSLSCLCLQILNGHNVKKMPQKIATLMQNRITRKVSEAVELEKMFFSPSETIVPGCSHGTPKIQIIENRIINDNERISFEDLLLATIKKPDIQIKKKKTKVSKGCEIITREDFLQKLRSDTNENKNKKIDKNAKQAKKTKNKNNNSKNKSKKRINKIQDSSEESSDEGKIILNDSDSGQDWDTFCEMIRQDNKEISYNDYEISTDNFEEIPNKSRGTRSANNGTRGKNKNTGYVQDCIYQHSPRRRPQVCDWIIVKFATKKTLKHFVGNVISLDDENIPKVKFLRKIKNSKIQAFHYPDVEDILNITHDSDIVMFLEKPQITRRGHVIFSEQLKEFNIQ